MQAGKGPLRVLGKVGQAQVAAAEPMANKDGLVDAAV